MLCHTTVGLATMVGLVALAGYDGRTPSLAGAAHRGLASGPLRSVGLFSYSLYLVHYPIVAIATISWLDRYELNVPATFAILSLACVPASLLVAKVFFLLAERPFLNTPASQ
jgi:peptidoglycan/LPS O-acetylase OafA/YrhL